MNGVPVTLPLTLATGSVQGIGFAARKGTDYYLSVTDSDSASRSFRWADGLDTAPVELDGVTAPLVAVTGDGTDTILLSSDGLTMTAHDKDGTVRYSFPVGSLRFVHERYDTIGEQWLAVFIRTLFIRDQQNDNGTFSAQIFEIPVTKLGSLAP